MCGEFAELGQAVWDALVSGTINGNVLSSSQIIFPTGMISILTPHSYVLQ